MIFPDYFVLRAYAVCLAFLTLGIWMFRAGKGKPLRLQIPLRFFSVLFIGVSSLFLLLSVACGGVTEHSEPIYSPDRKHAIRITINDAGALGGSTVVDLYSFHGLIANRIATGDWTSPKSEDVKWLGNAEVLISYKNGLRPPDKCKSAQSVVVRCDPPPPNSSQPRPTAP
jgi:hypothetical protein